ncbi:MAG: hypothetical protein PUC00_10290 [Clostridiales bacterium]|nr:hypothetical protein [Clostridiales bacterium]
MQDIPLWRRMLKAVLASLLTVVLLSAFYLAVIMGNPHKEEGEGGMAALEQPLLSALPAPVTIREQSQLSQLRAAFPAPMMAAMNSSAMALVEGACRDVPFENGLARTVTLTYRTAEGGIITVESIYPARALSLVGKGDYTLSATAGLTLAGYRSVRMENDHAVRMHAQGAEALYVVTLPALSAQALRTLTSTLQLQ